MATPKDSPAPVGAPPPPELVQAVFATLFQAHTDAFVLTGSDRRILSVNPAACRAFGYASEELVGQTTRILYESEQEYREQGEQRYSESAGRSFASYPIRYRRKDGSTFLSETIGGAVRDEQGETVGFFGVIRDVTERDELRRIREIAAAEMEKRVRQRTVELRALTRALSHDLRNPLIAISGFSRLLERVMGAECPPKAHEYAERIRDAAAWMQSLVGDLTELLSVQDYQPHCAVLELGELVHKVVDVERGMLDEKGVEVRVGREFPPVFADERLIRRVVANLVQNAGKFIGDPPHPKVEIDAVAETTHIVVSVADNGKGVAAEDAERIFELFERDPETAEGSGLGLSIARRFVELHGGRIWVESDGPGTGSTFKFTLPAVPRNP